MFFLSFSQSLLATGVIFWLVYLGVDVIGGLRKTPVVDPIASLCFFGAVAASFLAGAVYGHEAEYEKAQRGRKLHEGYIVQPPFGSGKDKKDQFFGELC